MGKSKEDDEMLYQQFFKEDFLRKYFHQKYDDTKERLLEATLTGEIPFPDTDHSLERGFEILSKKTRELSISLSTESNKIPVSKHGLFGTHHVTATHKETKQEDKKTDKQQTTHSDKPKRS